MKLWWILMLSPVLFMGCADTPTKAPSLGGVGSAIAVMGNRVDDAQANASAVQKLAAQAYEKGLTAKSADAIALKNKVQELQGNLAGAKLAEKFAYEAKDKAQDEVNRVAKEAAKVPELQKAVGKRNVWMLVSCLITVVCFLIGYYGAKFFTFTTAFAGPWGAALAVLTKFLPVEVLAGVLAALAWIIILSALLTLWSGFGWIGNIFT